MRTTKSLTVSLPPAIKRAMERTAKKENRTMSELVRETWRHYQLKQQVSVNTDLIAALRAVQASAKRVGLDKLTEREIEAEVTAHRRERDKKIKQSVR
jgi:predicted transcriptional regulator